MKDQYIKPQIEEISIDPENIIAISGGPTGGDLENPDIQTTSGGLFENN